MGIFSRLAVLWNICIFGFAGLWFSVTRRDAISWPCLSLCPIDWLMWNKVPSKIVQVFFYQLVPLIKVDWKRLFPPIDFLGLFHHLRRRRLLTFVPIAAFLPASRQAPTGPAAIRSSSCQVYKALAVRGILETKTFVLLGYSALDICRLALQLLELWWALPRNAKQPLLYCCCSAPLTDATAAAAVVHNNMAAFVSLFWQHTELRLLLTNFWSWTLPRSADSYLRHIDLNRIFEGLSCLIWSVRRTDQMTDCTWRFGKHRESAKPGSQLFRTLWEDLGTTLAGFCSNGAEKH